MLICVVRMVALKVGAIDRAAVVILEKRSVDSGRVAIELHTEPQTVGKYRGDRRSLFGELALFFHQRGKRHRIVDIGAGMQLLPDIAELAGHQPAQAIRRGVAAETVSAGKKIALE